MPEYPEWLKMFNAIKIAAAEHGQNDDVDHEIGDLQDALSDCLRIMTPEQLSTLKMGLVERQDGFSECYEQEVQENA